MRWASAFLFLAACGAGEEDVLLPDPALVREAMEQARVPGLALATLEGCAVNRVETHGVADAATGDPVTDDTVFEAASLSKPVFAYLVLQLAGEGEIDLDAAIADTIDFPRAVDQEAFRSLTPRLILSHRSGLPNWSGDPADPTRRDPITFTSKPGERFSYSGEAYGLLGRHVEATTGTSLERLFRQRLGDAMPGATYADPLPAGLHPAWGHDGNGAKAGGRPIGRPTHQHPAYTLRSTIASYAAFAERLCSGEGLLPEVYGAFTAPESLAEGGEWGGTLTGGSIAWGLGIGRQEADGRVTLFHWGDNDEFKAFVAVVPETGAGVVFFANGWGGLKLVGPVAEPVVGNLGPVIGWLGYGAP